MSYLVQSQLASDSIIQRRVTACAAVEGIPDPFYWVQQRMWDLSSQPGWVEAYRSGGSVPGENEEAITDEMILEAVRKLNAPSQSGV